MYEWQFLLTVFWVSAVIATVIYDITKRWKYHENQATEK